MSNILLDSICNELFRIQGTGIDLRTVVISVTVETRQKLIKETNTTPKRYIIGVPIYIEHKSVGEWMIDDGWNLLYCSQCHEKQYYRPDGDCCLNEHKNVSGYNDSVFWKTKKFKED